jgi:superfamily II DNA or RNA helicase/HKD family nuclease
MSKLERGLYEQLLTQGLEGELNALDGNLTSHCDPLHPEEAPDRIALYLGQLIRRAVSGMDRGRRAAVGVSLARNIASLLASHPGSAVEDSDLPTDQALVLRSILGVLPTGEPERIALPATPLLDTTLLTNAPGEPRIGHQLSSEIPSSDRIDVLMAFVRQTGIRPLADLLRRHCEQGRRLRVLTTTYTGSTELAALIALRNLGADVRVSYDTTSTRLHAKAWQFHRSSGYSTAYIGSSNLTHSAQITGLEWNVRVSGARNPDVIEKFSAVFESYWSQPDFREFDEAEFKELTKAQNSGPRIFLSPAELRPEPYQARLLELISLSRARGHHRNLLVSATGTGKTVMAALDYVRLRQTLPRSRLLFIAHRKEILDQSLATFRYALRDASFGELWVDGQTPDRFEHVFASIQSLSAAKLENIDPDAFDVVIVDEFHHAAAKTYKAVLNHLQPRELLGLTATPERADGESILEWFEGRISAELRLWDAIDQQRLAPFAYYGISDGTDLRTIGWTRGQGYDTTQLTNLVTANDVLARLVISQLVRLVPDTASMRALGFCVSVRHAEFMAQQFLKAGIPAAAITGETPSNDREKARRDLASGELSALFTVDLFNEGVDIPSVDTILLLRPTDSATLFLQQLGRGLRLHPGKQVCTVLDFIGRHRKEFQFQRKLGALLGGSRTHLMAQVKSGFPFLPSGCHMQLDPVAASTVLDNLRESLPYTWPAKAAELSRVAEQGEALSLAMFLRESGLALEDIYSSSHCWSDLLEAGGLATAQSGPAEVQLRRGIGRLLHVDDLERISRYREWASSEKPPCTESMSLRHKRLLHMLVAVLLDRSVSPTESLDDATSKIWAHPQVLAEIVELMRVLDDRVDHEHQQLPDRSEIPLNIHARYSRREILAAIGPAINAELPAWREGVRWFPEEKVDALAFTLDKSGGSFSPTTRYRDYAISREVIHWESQSTTRSTSETGRRYQSHDASGSLPLLFARMSPDDRSFWFLGPASYISHEGDRPMAIQWRLSHPLPGDLYAKFAVAIG